MVLKTDERSAARSKTDEADARLLWATSEHQRQRSGSGYAAQPTAGPNAAATSADTDENGRVCVDGLGPYALRCCSSHNRSSDGLLIRTIRMRRMHHMRGGADDVTGLSTAALTASTHANLSGCSGHAMPTGVGLASMQLPPVAS